jgi:hypothetical protein
MYDIPEESESDFDYKNLVHIGKQHLIGKFKIMIRK